MSRAKSDVPRDPESPLTPEFTWRRKVYAGTSGASSGRRKPPPPGIRREILARQAGCCLYCGLPFGSQVTKGFGPARVLRLTWDHIRPFSLLMASPRENWAAACHICNSIKGSRVFDGPVQAAEYINQVRRNKRIEAVAQ